MVTNQLCESEGLFVHHLFPIKIASSEYGSLENRMGERGMGQFDGEVEEMALVEPRAREWTSWCVIPAPSTPGTEPYCASKVHLWGWPGMARGGDDKGQTVNPDLAEDLMSGLFPNT